MSKRREHNGFSLTEVLLAVGTLAVGMVFIAGVFPVAIYYSTISSERTIAAVVAEEAFAKIKQQIGNLDSIDTDYFFNQLDDEECVDFNEALPANTQFETWEYRYPSTEARMQKQYCWSALCRLTEDANSINNPRPLVQVTVFVCRKAGLNLKYPEPGSTTSNSTVDWPAPFNVDVDPGTEDNELRISNSTEKNYINDGCTIIDDRTGRIYRVLDRYKGTDDDTILLDKDWIERDWDDRISSSGSNNPSEVWVIPPPVNGGRYPCIAVYQRLMIF